MAMQKPRSYIGRCAGAQATFPGHCTVTIVPSGSHSCRKPLRHSPSRLGRIPQSLPLPGDHMRLCRKCWESCRPSRVPQRQVPLPATAGPPDRRLRQYTATLNGTHASKMISDRGNPRNCRCLRHSAPATPLPTPQQVTWQCARPDPHLLLKTLPGCNAFPGSTSMFHFGLGFAPMVNGWHIQVGLTSAVHRELQPDNEPEQVKHQKLCLWEGSGRLAKVDWDVDPGE